VPGWPERLDPEKKWGKWDKKGRKPAKTAINLLAGEIIDRRSGL